MMRMAVVRFRASRRAVLCQSHIVDFHRKLSNGREETLRSSRTTSECKADVLEKILKPSKKKNLECGEVAALRHMQDCSSRE